MQLFSGITQVHLQDLVFSKALSFSHWLMLSAQRGRDGRRSSVTSVIFCWCGGKNSGWETLGLTVVFTFHVPCDLDQDFLVPEPPCPHSNNDEVDTLLHC